MADSRAASGSLPYVPFDTLDHRHNAILIVLAGIHLLVGAYLAVFGRRFWRITCALALGLAAELLSFSLVVNLVPDQGWKSSYSAVRNDLASFGIIVSAACVALMLSLLTPRRWYIGWWLGWASLGLLGGLSVAFSLLIVKGDQLLISSQAGRWAMSGVLAALGFIFVLVTEWLGARLCGCLVGAWLLALAVDLLVNVDHGAAYGLRVLLDRKPTHRAVSEGSLWYSVIRKSHDERAELLFPMSWILALFCCLLQYYILGQDLPFLPLRRPTESEVPSSKVLHTPSGANDDSHHGPGRFRIRGRPSLRIQVQDIEKQAESPAPLATNAAPVALSPTSETSSVHAMSTLADSELHMLTENYRRALAALDEEAGSLNGSMTPQGLANGTPDAHGGNAILTRGLNSARGMNPVDDELPAAGEVPSAMPRPVAQTLKRAESDRATTYSVPLTNITNPEYFDRDRRRPPSWVGDLPWNPAMLRGPLDPRTLPSHPPSEGEPLAGARVYTVDDQQPAAEHTWQAGVQSEAPALIPHPAVTSSGGSRAAMSKSAKAQREAVTSVSPISEEFELVDRPTSPPDVGSKQTSANKPLRLTISGPLDSRSVAQRASPSSVADGMLDVSTHPSGASTPNRTGLGGSSASKRSKANRTSVREPRLQLQDDDLPESGSPILTNFTQPLPTSSSASARAATGTVAAADEHSQPPTPIIQTLPSPRLPQVVRQDTAIDSNAGSVSQVPSSPGSGPPPGLLHINELAGLPEPEQRRVRFTSLPRHPGKSRRSLFSRRRSGLSQTSS